MVYFYRFSVRVLFSLVNVLIQEFEIVLSSQDKEIPEQENLPKHRK